MDWVWTWSGRCFGYRDSEDLWTHRGVWVGRFHGDDVFGSDGDYLGELMSGNRLITNRAKKSRRAARPAVRGRGGNYAPFANYAAYAMYAGHEDFPGPDRF